MDEKKLDAIAAKIATPERSLSPPRCIFPTCSCSSSRAITPRRSSWSRGLPGKQYRDTYMELSGTVTPNTKIFVQDMGEPGLSQKKQDNMYDTWTRAGKIVMFDGDPDKQKMSDADYLKSFTAADEEYAKILSALLLEAKK